MTMTLTTTPTHQALTAELAQLATADKELTESSKSDSTRRIYQTLFYGNGVKASGDRGFNGTERALPFALWCDRYGFASLPADANTVAGYVTYLSEMGRSVSAASSAVAAIRFIHRAAGHTSPTDAERVSTVLTGMRNQRAKAGILPAKKAAATLDVLRAMADQITGDDLFALRDRAMLLTGFAGAFRRSELVALVASDVSLKVDAMVIRIRKSKTDQGGKGQYKTIAVTGGAYCAVGAMRAWLKAAQVKDGCVFLQIERKWFIG